MISLYKKAVTTKDKAKIIYINGLDNPDAIIKKN